MTKNAEGVLLKKSKLTTNGKPNLPAPSKLVEGELAINYAEGVETISTKNESGTVVTFSSDDYYTSKKLGSGFTGVNSARTVTDAIVNADWDEEDETSGAFIKNKPFGETCEYEVGFEGVLTVPSDSPIPDRGSLNFEPSNVARLSLGDTYRVTIDGVVYEEVAEKVLGVTNHIGLHFYEGQSTPYNDTWCLFDSTSTNYILNIYGANPGDSFNVKYEKLVCTVKQIENKYLDTPWEKGTERGSAKIINNTGIANGFFTISEGYATSAVTDGMPGGVHAEGYMTYASGQGVHAEGDNTKALSQGSHSEGISTLASGMATHAEGYSSSAITNGPSAHAEGYGTLASGMATHAEGYASSAITQGMPSVHAEGYMTYAGNGAAHAEGQSTSATSMASHAEGQGTIASGGPSHAEGQGTIASGNNGAHAEGLGTIASGNNGAHAEGNSTSATSYASHAEGNSTLASGSSSHAEGYGTKASGQNSHAEGNSTSATSQYSHAEGNATIASGDSSHAEGWNTVASGRYGSHAEGYNTKATADYNSHAEGYGSIASGNYGSHAEGNNTIASGRSSHAEGSATSATSQYSHSEGYHTLASGQSSHAEGYETVANGNYSHTEGYRTIANNYFEHAGGICNISYSATSTFGDSGNTLFSIGNGENYNTRHNAFEIRQNGDIYIVNKAGQDVRLQDEIGNIDVDQVLDETTSASTNPVATKAVYDVYHEFETVVSAAINDLETKKLEESDVDQVIDSTTSGSPLPVSTSAVCQYISSYVPSITVDQTIDDTTSASTNPVSTSGVYGFVTSYTPSITVDQVLDDTTSASTNPVSSKAVYDAVTDNEMVWANAYVAISGAISSHTEDTNIHLTSSEKEGLTEASTITSIDGYDLSQATAAAIDPLTDTLLQAIAKLEKRIYDLEHPTNP